MSTQRHRLLQQVLLLAGVGLQALSLFLLAISVVQKTAAEGVVEVPQLLLQRVSVGLLCGAVAAVAWVALTLLYRPILQAAQAGNLVHTPPVVVVPTELTPLLAQPEMVPLAGMGIQGAAGMGAAAVVRRPLLLLRVVLAVRVEVLVHQQAVVHIQQV